MTSDITPVGPDVYLEYPVVTEAGFPWGLRCAECDRQIPVGRPYSSRAEGVYDNGDTMGLLVCVYC